MEQTNKAMEQANKALLQESKRPYHSPALRACGNVKEQTLLGTGAITDAQWSTASRLSP